MINYVNELRGSSTGWRMLTYPIPAEQSAIEGSAGRLLAAGIFASARRTQYRSVGELIEKRRRATRSQHFTELASAPRST